MADVMPTTPEALCAREPIHIPGAIQPHGWLLAVGEETLRVEQLSANWPELWPEEIGVLQGKPVVEWDAELGTRIREVAAVAVADAGGGSYQVTLGGRLLAATQHRSGGSWVVELEPSAVEEMDFLSLQGRQGIAVARLHGAKTIAALCQVAAEEMALLSGFDRVMVYQFHPDWHGEVVAEVCAPGLEPFLGLHYPASDIPEQARRLYTRNWLRLIATSHYRPVPLLPALNPRTGQPLDLTHSTLRSVSPVHLEYLRNMGVSGSMSVSIIEEGRLWGLIACHHRTPRKLPSAVRIACELVGRVTSALLGAAHRSAVQEARLAAKAARESFLDRLAERLDFAEALAEDVSAFLSVMQATSALIVLGGNLRQAGVPLPPELVEASLKWLRDHPHADFIAVDHLEREVPAAAPHRHVASGLFAIALTETQADWLVWFRPEQAQTVNWAGNPEKSLQDLALPIQPRKSFALWTQQVTGVCATWTEMDEATALEMRAAANASIRKRTEHLMNLNEELMRKNSDLSSFAYIASHDLREPLRGIRNILRFFSEDHGSALEKTARDELEVASRAATRMHDMLEALLHYTRVGRKELVERKVPLASILERALEIARPQWKGQSVEVVIAPDLPQVRCDRVMMAEVFTNLFTNAVKYNVSAVKRLEVSAEAVLAGRVEISVRDNGIGIDPRHAQEVFTMFRRLHRREEYQGGLGVGLAVVKAIVERHGGTIRVDSHDGRTTFLLTLDS